MPFIIVRNDITRMRTDAIVNAANNSLLGGGGVDGAIHRAAGPELLEECRTLGGCETGQAKITRGYRLPAKYVIHTVGPVWHGGRNGEKELLTACYRNSLMLAEKYGCESVAFPMISAGAYGYPKEQAAGIAADTITAFLQDHDMTVYLVVFGSDEFRTGKKLFREVQEYIDDNYADSHFKSNVESVRAKLWHRDSKAAMEMDQALAETDSENKYSAPRAELVQNDDKALFMQSGKGAKCSFYGALQDDLEQNDLQYAPTLPIDQYTSAKTSAPSAPDWEALLRKTDEGFSEALLRLITERGMTDAQCYKKANVDRKLFSKIRSNPAYKPGKPTVMAFAVALELDLRETKELLKKAGFALSRSSRFDIILEYFIKTRQYNIYEINEVLFQYDMPLLGSGMN